MQKRGIFLYSFIPGLLLALGLGAGGLKISSVASGDLIKGSLPAVYYLGADNKRYVFPNDKVYFSWYADFSGVKTISDPELASYMLGGNATYRPGTRLVKIQSDPRVYAVGMGGVLRWISSEAAANAIFGSGWNKKVDDIADAFFINYSVGAAIDSAADYDPASAASADPSINIDKNLSAPAPVNNNSNANANTNTNGNVNQPLSCAASCAIGSVCEAGSCAKVVPQSNLSVKEFVVDSADLCFVGDACAGGSCCSINGVSFADNADFKSINKNDINQYGDKQQLCGTTSISSYTQQDINAALVNYSGDISTATATHVNVGNTESTVNGILTMSRVPGTCDWWFSPADLAPFLNQNIDPSTDAVFVIASRYFTSGDIPGPATKNLPPGSGLRGAGYYYMTAEAVDPSAGVTYSSLFSDALTAAQNDAFSAGLFDVSKAITGNYCRDGKKDFDETGVDCGGAECNACY